MDSTWLLINNEWRALKATAIYSTILIMTNPKVAEMLILAGDIVAHCKKKYDRWSCVEVNLRSRKIRYYTI
jgi:hypothetical protein